MNSESDPTGIQQSKDESEKPVRAQCDGSPLITYPLRLMPGEELVSTLKTFVEQNRLQGAFILSCVGSVTRVKLRMADSQTVKALEGPFEIVSLVGTLSGGSHLHGSFSDREGLVTGGHIIGDAVIYTTAEVVIVKGGSDNLSAETEAPECLETDLKALMESIQSGDLVHCQAVISKMDSKFLNKRVKIAHPQYKDVRVSPLLAAVIFRRHDALELLLSRNVKVDKMGYYEDQNILYTVTPLLKAIMNADTRSVKMLLHRGARVQIGIPGPKIAEEEGYYYQYTKMSFPLNHAMQAGLGMFKLVFQNADALMEYGEYRHTCLCYAIGHYLSDPEIVDPSFIQFIAQNGGMICGGRRYNKDRDRLCFYLCDLFFKSFGGPKMSTFSPGLPVHVTYMFSENHIEIVKLLCLLEYNHAGSIVQKFMKTYGSLLCKSFKPLHWEHIKLNYPDVVAFVSWVTNYSQTPSSLKEICRCAIRQSIHRISVEKCHSLPLPSDLKRFLCLETRLAIRVPDSVCLHCYGTYILKEGLD